MTPLTDSERALVTQHVRLAGLAASRTREYGRRVGFEYDELFSIACLGLVKGVRNFDPSISKPGTFLYTCCMREILKTIRYQRSSKRSGMTVVSLEEPVLFSERGEPIRVADTIPDQSSDLVEHVALKNDLARFLPSLPPAHRQILGMLYSGMTQTEIADSLGRTQTSVSRTIQTLRRHFRKIHFEEVS